MIYTLSLNPAIDYCVKPSRFDIGEINSCNWSRVYPGGKGINVSRVLCRLGADTVALGFIAGFTGDALQQELYELGIRTDFVRLPKGNTRINIKIRSGKETDINCNGPEIDVESLEKLYDKLKGLSDRDVLVLSGSLPNSLPENTYENILERMKGQGVTVVADTCGKKLLSILKYRPFLIKPNHLELGEIFGVSADTVDDILPLARRLQSMGAGNVLVSRAADGAVLLTESGKVLEAPLFKGIAVNTVGAGDSMLAGFLYSFYKQGDMEAALRFAAACGAATAFSDDLANKEDIYRLLAK